MKKLLVLCGLVAVAGVLAFAGSAKADYGKAAYQITFSENCNNISLCGGFGSGSWGWAALNADGTGDLEVTFCGHATGGGGGGAGHESVDIFHWSIHDGFFFIDSASDPGFVGQTPIPFQDLKSYHFSSRPAPGINSEGQVTRIPTS